MIKTNFDCLKNTMMGMTYEEVEDAVKKNAIVLFPVGVVEAHGPHLPLGTDIFIALNKALEVKRYFEAEGGECVIMQKGNPDRGAFVFYDCICNSENGQVNWGHCGISLGDGNVIHAWDVVRKDNYPEIENMTALSGYHPKYIGWVPLERVLTQSEQ